MSESEPTAGSPAKPLSTVQIRAATAILARAWGEPVALDTAEPIWGRSHVVRLGTRTGRTAVLKREREHGRTWPTFGMEAAVLDYLYAMPAPVAPRLFGTDADAAYLIAPFPSCWCFATLPAEVARTAVATYEAELETAGVTLGPDWADRTTAALAGLIIARGPMLAGALQEDQDWGTTTIRPRLLAWLGSFTGRAGHGTLPRLQATMAAMRERLTERWPDVRIPEYPGLAGAGADLARIPDGWQPRP